MKYIRCNEVICKNFVAFFQLFWCGSSSSAAFLQGRLVCKEWTCNISKSVGRCCTACNKRATFETEWTLFKCAKTLKDQVWGPVVQWLVQRFRSERLRVRSRWSATFTPSAHVRRQSLPVWSPTLKNYLYLLPFLPKHLACGSETYVENVAQLTPKCKWQDHKRLGLQRNKHTLTQPSAAFVRQHCSFCLRVAFVKVQLKYI